MAYEDLKLIKCFRFDKDKQRWGMCDEWVSKYKEEASGLHVFAYGGNEVYIASTRYSAHGQSDGVDSEHYDNIIVALYPISMEDAKDEEKVKAVIENTECVYSGSFDASQIKLYDESYYSDSIMFPVFYAIDAYKSSIKKRQVEEKMGKGEISVGPNAVCVYKKDDEKKPKPLTILDFDSQTTLADIWGFDHCSSVGIEPMNEKCSKDFGIDRMLCYFYPIAGSFGRPEVSTYIRHDGKRSIPVYFSNNWDTGGSAVICAYVKGKPAPLTEAEVQKILDFVKDDAK